MVMNGQYDKKSEAWMLVIIPELGADVFVELFLAVMM